MAELFGRRILLGVAASIALTGMASAGCSRPMVMPIAQVQQARSAMADVAKLHRLVQDIGMTLGCEFTTPQVPRPRLQQMLLTGMADVMLPAARDAERDAVALFVPMTRAPLELLMRKGAPRRPADFQSLVSDASLRGLMVRGQSWGGALDAAMGEEASRRIQRVGDFLTVMRMLVSGRADYSVVSSSLVRGMGELAVTRELTFQLEAAPLRGMPDVELGAYVSGALGPADRALMIRLLSHEAVRAHMQTTPAGPAASATH